jgi:hypothetical protein
MIWSKFTADGEWPIVSRDRAVAERHDGGWVIWLDRQPVAMAKKNSSAWFAYEALNLV